MKSAIAVLALASLTAFSGFAAPQSGQGTATQDTTTKKHAKKHSTKHSKKAKAGEMTK